MAITTPIMLVTLMAYLDNNREKYKNIYEYIKENKSFITEIVVLNSLMLIFGIIGELNYIDYKTGIMLGFVPFIYYYKLIYDKYVKDKDLSKDKKILFWFFFIVWSLYGIVAFLQYEQKNTSYNILDTISKNLFGIFLVYILWTKRIDP